MTEGTPQRDGRWPVLAGLRFALAIVVLSGHLSMFVPLGRPLRLVSDLGGSAAVLGFLVISGYSIAHSMARRPDGFYRRRVLRIYPVYVLATAYSLLPSLPAIGVVRPPSAGVVVGNLLLLQTIVCLPIGANFANWTLAVEAACYAAAPWLRRWSTGWLTAVGAASAGAFVAYPHTGLPHFAASRYGLPLALFGWGWLAGLLLHRSGTAPRWGVGVAIVGAGLLWIDQAHQAAASAPAFAASALLVTFAGRVAVRPVVARGLNVLGDLSYPVYLFHMPTFLIAAAWHVRSQAVLVAATLAVSGVAVAFEAGVRAWVGRHRPRSERPAMPALPAAPGMGADTGRGA